MDAAQCKEANLLRLHGGYCGRTARRKNCRGSRKGVHAARRQDVAVFDKSIDEVGRDHCALRVTRNEYHVRSVQIFHPLIVP